MNVYAFHLTFWGWPTGSYLDDVVRRRADGLLRGKAGGFSSPYGVECEWDRILAGGAAYERAAREGYDVLAGGWAVADEAL
ncbi:hypothetical protein AB5J72_35220 [Streptomyces sp. CG1]|uniref:hypothetical protein n=1 Tax=Streptomyces sp. CG1 TaxID=1287523 RepID=UPI0034E299A3